MNPLILVAVCLLFLESARAEISESRKREISSAISTNSLLDVSDYPPDEKRWIVDWVLKFRQTEPGLSDDSFDLQLLQIGYGPTVEKYGKLVSDGGSSPYISRSRQPRLLPYFESQLQIAEPAWTWQTSDRTMWRNSTSAAASMLFILSESGEIPKDVRIWARDAYNQLKEFGFDEPKARKGLEEARRIVRDWWTENKAAIVAERFADVKPGRVHSFTLDKQPKPEPLTPAESVLKRPGPLAEDSASPKTAQEAAEATPEGSNWFWIVPAVCVALGVGFFAAFRRKA